MGQGAQEIMANASEDIFGGSLGVFPHRRIGLPGSSWKIFRDCHTQRRRGIVAQGIMNDLVRLNPLVFNLHIDTHQDFNFKVLTCFCSFSVKMKRNSISLKGRI